MSISITQNCRVLWQQIVRGPAGQGSRKGFLGRDLDRDLRDQQVFPEQGGGEAMRGWRWMGEKVHLSGALKMWVKPR